MTTTPCPSPAMLADLHTLDVMMVWTAAAMVVVGILLLIVTWISRNEEPVLRHSYLAPPPMQRKLPGDEEAVRPR